MLADSASEDSTRYAEDAGYVGRGSARFSFWRRRAVLDDYTVIPDSTLHQIANGTLDCILGRRDALLGYKDRRQASFELPWLYRERLLGLQEAESLYRCVIG